MFNNNTSAQTFAREDDGLGSLNHRQARVAQQEWQRRIEAYSAGYIDLKAQGRMDEAEAVRSEGRRLINERYGL